MRLLSDPEDCSRHGELCCKGARSHIALHDMCIGKRLLPADMCHFASVIHSE